MLKALFASKVPILPKELTYEEARGVLEQAGADVCKELAGRADVPPEMLYYLAESQQSDVREIVAANPATPVQADAILADDQECDVRMELARKIGRLVPNLNDDEMHRTRQHVIGILEKLARDQMPRVRRIVAEEIKQAGTVPHHLVIQLANDPELEVCAPILEYSPLLSDEDLLEIIAAGTVSGALAAIARRAEVGGDVSDAVVASLEVPAVAALLANPSAQIREDTLDRIIDMAEGLEALHEPLVLRQDLSLRATRRIAGFVACALLDAFQRRHDLDEETLAVVRTRVRERVATITPDAPDAEEADAAIERVIAARDSGSLDDAFVVEAAKAGEIRVVTFALAELAKVPIATVQQILASKAGKAITALVWKAELPMRTALKVQTFIAKVPKERLQNAKDGVHYALTPEEMSWQLSCFGVDC